MVDISKIRIEVSNACARYRKDLADMSSAAASMSMYKEQEMQAERELTATYTELNSTRDEMDSLRMEIATANEDDNNAAFFATQKLNLLMQKQQALGVKLSEVQGKRDQARRNYEAERHKYEVAEKDAEKVREYLEKMREQMSQAASEFQRKIDGFNTSIQILGGAGNNMFASSANAQVENLTKSRNQYQDNLEIARSLIEEIDGTLGGGQGGSTTTTFSRGGRHMGGFETGPEREMTNEPNVMGELHPGSSSHDNSGWDSLSDVPFAGRSRTR